MLGIIIFAVTLLWLFFLLCVHDGSTVLVISSLGYEIHAVQTMTWFQTRDSCDLIGIILIHFPMYGSCDVATAKVKSTKDDEKKISHSQSLHRGDTGGIMIRIKYHNRQSLAKCYLCSN